jgi:putative nucleotidyltransferase-like protein
MTIPHIEQSEDWRVAALSLLRWAGHTGDIDLRSLRLTPSVLSELAVRRIDSLFYAVCGTSYPIQGVYDAMWLRQLAALQEFSRALSLSGIPFIVLKAADSVPRWYANQPLGMIGDLDVLVAPDATSDVKQILLQLGYRQALVEQGGTALRDAPLSEIANLETTKSELFPFIRLEPLDVSHAEFGLTGRFLERSGSQTPLLSVEIDVHYGLRGEAHLAEFEAEGVFRRARPAVRCDGLALCDTDAVWYVLAKYYGEVATLGKNSLRDFAYAIPAITRGKVDWELLMEIAGRGDLSQDLYYYLAFINRLIVGSVPGDVLINMHPRRRSSRRGGHDWGWQLSRLFSYQVGPTHDRETVARALALGA